MISRAWLIGAGVGAAIAITVHAQPKRPIADLMPTVVTSPTRSGATVRLALKVHLPPEIHVQSDKPKDPFLIPTAVTVTPPPAVTVDRIAYPKATDFTQAGRSEPLKVFGGEFTIDVELTLSADVPSGELVIPAVFRYQPCDASVCFAPARADVKWTLTVDGGGGGGS